MNEPQPVTITTSARMLHTAIRAGCRFAERTFDEKQPDGLMTIGAAIVLATAAYSVGIVRALGEPK